MKKILCMILCLLVVGALILSSCQTTTEEEGEGQTITGQVTEQETEEEEEEAVTEDTGPEMVRDINGNLVEKPRYGGTITVSATSNPICWDPYRNLGGGASDFGQCSIYDVLIGGDWSVDRDESSFLTKNILLQYTTGFSAESWENPDPLTYVIHLRQGMKFQNKPPVNGREVVANDVKYSIDRMLGLGEFAEVGGSPYVGFSAWTVLESVEVVDKYTVIFHLNKASPTFPDYWGPEVTPFIHPREVVDTYGENFRWDQAVGHGPWMVDDVVIDSGITYLKHPQYYGVDANFPDNPIPYADKLKVLIITDDSTRFAALRTGKLDLVYTDWENAGTLRETDPQLKWARTPGSCQVVNLNYAKEPYTDIRVRKAMQMAINLPEIADTLFGGNGDSYPFMASKGAMAAYFTPFDELDAETQEGFTYNPERAKELLAEAGYPNGFKQEMPMNAASDLADLFIAYWNQVGIETDIRLMEGAAYSSFVYGGEQEIAWFWSCGTWYPLEVLNFWYGGQDTVPWNFANTDDPVFNDLMDRIRVEQDQMERDSLMKEAFLYGTTQFYYTAAPSVDSYRLWSPWLKGYQGEIRLVVTAEAHTFARTWVDQDLKYEMTGTRD